jgi:hypothetical protein
LCTLRCVLANFCTILICSFHQLLPIGKVMIMSIQCNNHRLMNVKNGSCTMLLLINKPYRNAHGKQSA